MIYDYIKNLTGKKALKLFRFFLKIKNKGSIFSLISSKPIILKYEYDRRIFLFEIKDIDELSILFEIFENNVYSIKKTDKKIIILDIGANIGLFAIYCKYLCPNSTIYSFEPNPKAYNNIIKNIKLNKFNEDNIILNNFGLSDKTKDAILYINKRDADATTINPNGFIKKKLDIRLKSFKGFLKDKRIKKIDILKIDIEGGEYELLESLSKSDFKKIKSIQIEIHNLDNKRNEKNLLDLLKKYYSNINHNGMLHYLDNETIRSLK